VKNVRKLKDNFTPSDPNGVTLDCIRLLSFRAFVNQQKEVFMAFNPALNTDSLPVRAGSTTPPALNALYLRDGKYDSMGRDEVAKTFQAFRDQTKTERLALFFHGGLVDKSSGQLSAAAEYDAYSDLVFPLFFIWESGIWEVLAHHLPLIFAETIFGRIRDHATDLVNKKLPPVADGVDALAVVPDLSTLTLSQEDIEAYMAAIRDDEAVQHEAVAIARNSQPVDTLLGADAAGKTGQLSPRTYLSPEVVSAVRGALVQSNRATGAPADSVDGIPFGIGGAIQTAWAIAKAAVPVILNCFKRFAKKRDHGVTCTIVEEVLRALYLANFGSSIWEEMKRETDQAFGADSTQFGGTAVIEELCNLIQQKPNTKVTLVGHSTGGVYIGNFLRHVDTALQGRGDSTTQFDIILMAPANTADFFASTYTNRIAGIRIFQMSDPTEQQDHLMSRDVGPADPSILGKVYPRSLLYLVSGVCEYFEGQGGNGDHAFDGSDMPILGMDRFTAKNDVFTAAEYPCVQEVRNQFSIGPNGSNKFARVLSPTVGAAEPGFRSQALKHGAFPRDAQTIESIQLCFQNGI
jgi:hypothetical protein